MAQSLRARRIRTVGSSAFPIVVDGSFNHDFNYEYYKSNVPTGYDVRASRVDLTFKSTGGGEVYRPRAIVDTTDAATTGTINAIHATAQIKSGATVSGAVNAIRATIETATTTPGGTISALELDSNLVGSSTHALNSSAFIRVTQSGSTDLGTLMILPAAEADGHSATVLCTAGADKAATHYIRCVAGSTPIWLLATTTAPAHS